MGKEFIEENNQAKSFNPEDVRQTAVAATRAVSGKPVPARRGRPVGSIIVNKQQTPEKGVSFGLVKEINVGELSQDTRDMLIQIWEMPMVFTRTDYLRKLGIVEKSFRNGFFQELRAIDVRSFDYVALVEGEPAGRQESVVVKVNKDAWREISAEARENNDKIASKIRRAQVYGDESR